MERKIKKFYEAYPMGGMREYTSLESLERLRKILRLIKDKNSIILNAGCGGGYMNNFLAAKTNCLIGIDISRNSILEAHKISNKLDNVNLILADINKIPIKPEKVDLCVCSEVIEHLLTPLQALKEIYNVLSSHGTLILTTPNKLNLVVIAIEILKKIGYQGYGKGEQVIENRLSPMMIQKLCSQAGFSIYKHEGIWFFPSFFLKLLPMKIRYKIVSLFRCLENCSISKYIGLYQILVLKKL